MFVATSAFVPCSWARSFQEPSGETATSETARSDDAMPTFSPEAIAFFERDVRPLLIERCAECHGAGDDEPAGGLRVDSRRALLAGGESGSAVVPGEPDRSLLIDAVHYRTFEMPPNERLGGDSIAILERWVDAGAPWPAEADENAAPVRPTEFAISEADRDWWAYRPLAPLPAPSTTVSVTSPIDAFVQQRLEQVGLIAAPSADDRTWLRRAHVDLTGLPPEIETTERFVADSRPDRRVREIDRLLASPGFGERWGRHWLDVVRFAQSDGYERDGEKPEIWRYRDWVIGALNEDLPYDRFVTLQLAGDELPEAGDAGAIATGFYRLGVWDDEPDDPVLAEFDERDDMLSTIGSALLGTTIGCARCHRHMFDPFSQDDYYGLLATVHGVRRNERARPIADSANLLPLGDTTAIEAWREDQATRLAAAIAERDRIVDSGEGNRDEAEQRITAIRDETFPFAAALGVREIAETLPATQVLARGNPATPLREIEPRTPELFGSESLAGSERRVRGVRSSGRRSALAAWIVADENPLTYRVIANRIWHQLFGVGLCASTGDFGKAGSLPTHPELLDRLADDLLRDDRSLKSLIRRVMSSESYGRSAMISDSRVASLDPDGRLLSHRRIRRMDAEGLRDAMLQAAGALRFEAGGRGYFPWLEGDVVAGGSRPGLGWEHSDEAQRHRRTVYAFVKRSLRDPLVEAFDYANVSGVLPERPVTTVAPQALILLNGRWSHRTAELLAERARNEARDADGDELAILVERAIGRPADAEMLTMLSDYRERRFADALRTIDRITLRPDVPLSLSEVYLGHLPNEAILPWDGERNPNEIGPASGFRAHRGRWGSGYEGIVTVDDDRRPFLARLAAEGNTDGNPAVAVGTLRTTIALSSAAERASLLAAGSVQDETFRGLELRFDVQREQIRLLEIGDQVRVLAERPWVPTTDPLEVTWSLGAPDASPDVKNCRVEIRGSEETIEFACAAEIGSGTTWGLSAWGAPVTFTATSRIDGDGRVDRVGIDRESMSELARRAARDRSLVDVARILLNTNEFAYVD